ncbi:cilia- and flagella-associated protein 298 [Condylostylus longicornis]|uniref:cilia- and flagella-associated protein 298 n=1 Tax=Condylostylus longicornis TaxID=2530218 RepID=UPI00244DC3D6|nr:cilia- and flagella-associated protein 298 [Condylostylus longicornis]
MVRIQIKHGDEDQFLYEASGSEKIENIIKNICAIYNGRLKIYRICAEMEDIAEHGLILPPEMIGLTDEQVKELKLTDPWADKHIPSGGYDINPDKIGRRNGRRPKEHMQKIIKNTINEAKQLISKKLIRSDKVLNLKIIEEAKSILKGCMTIVYPMGLPPHEPVRAEFTNTEDLEGTYASKEIIDISKAQLWFAGKQVLEEKQLSDYCGKNEKSKIIMKINQKGDGPPGREPFMSEETKKMLMAESFRRQEQLKKLELDEDDSYLNSKWADNKSLQKHVHGLDDIKFRFGK